MSKQFEQLDRDRHAARRINKQVLWTNPSMNALLGDEDSIAVITKKTRDLVFKTIEDGWQNLPLHAFWFAEYHHLAVIPRDDVPDARIISESPTGTRIKFNHNQPKARVSFSLTHGISQTLFPDIRLTTRSRLKVSTHDYSDEARTRKFQAMICGEQPHRKPRRKRSL